MKTVKYLSLKEKYSDNLKNNTNPGKCDQGIMVILIVAFSRFLCAFVAKLV